MGDLWYVVIRGVMGREVVDKETLAPSVNACRRKQQIRDHRDTMFFRPLRIMEVERTQEKTPSGKCLLRLRLVRIAYEYPYTDENWMT